MKSYELVKKAYENHVVDPYDLDIDVSDDIVGLTVCKILDFERVYRDHKYDDYYRVKVLLPWGREETYNELSKNVVGKSNSGIYQLDKITDGLIESDEEVICVVENIYNANEIEDIKHVRCDLSFHQNYINNVDEKKIKMMAYKPNEQS